MKRAMQSIPIVALLTVSVAHAAWNDYEEVRDLSLNAGDIDSLQIESRAGSLEIRGVSESSTIVAKAIIQVPEDDEEARQIIESDLVLSLEKNGSQAELKGYLEDSGWLSGSGGSVRLEVALPEGVSLVVDDGSGSIVVSNVAGDIKLDDESGSIEMTQVGGKVTIDDGSGSISIEDIGGDLSIVDGSGSLSVSHAAGDVSIDDGSGSITVSDVARNLTILNAGSGSVNVEDIQGEFDNQS